MADQDILSVLNELERQESANPLETPGIQPFALRIGDKEFTAKSPQEVQQLVDTTLQNANAYLQNLQQQNQQLVAELQKAQQTAKPKPPVSPENGGPKMDPREFLETLVDKDPTEAISQALEKNPAVIDRLVEKHPKFQQLETQLTYQAFTSRHPFYSDPQILTGLTNIVRQNNLPVNPNTLEMAAGWAVTNGYLAHEAVLREQQRQALSQQLTHQQQQAQPQQYDDFGEPMQQTQAVRPPPRTGGSQGQPTSVQDRIAQRFNGSLTTQQMKQLLEMQQNMRVDL